MLSRLVSLGIGASIALALAQAGAHVILVHRSPSTPTTTLDTIRSQGYPASVVYADLVDKGQVKALYPSALKVLNDDTDQQRTRIEILVHAAGIQRRAPAAEFKDDEWEEVSLAHGFLSYHYRLMGGERRGGGESEGRPHTLPLSRHARVQRRQNDLTYHSPPPLTCFSESR